MGPQLDKYSFSLLGTRILLDAGEVMEMTMKDRPEPFTPYLRERGRAGGNSSQEVVGGQERREG